MSDARSSEPFVGNDWDFDKATYIAAPSIENFLKLRRKYPDRDPPNQFYAGAGALIAMDDDLKYWGIDPSLVELAMQADGKAIEKLSAKLLELLNSARKLELSGETQIVSRQKAPPESFIDYLIIIILESIELHKAPLAMPSLNFLIRERLGGLNMAMHQAYQKLATKKIAVALMASSRKLAQQDVFKEQLSLSATARFLDIDKSSLSRMFSRGELEELVAAEMESPSFDLRFLEGNTLLEKTLQRDVFDQHSD